MSPGELACWESMIEPLWAEEVLRDRGGSLGADDLYRLTLLATGDRRKAEIDRARRWLEEKRGA